MMMKTMLTDNDDDDGDNTATFHMASDMNGIRTLDHAESHNLSKKYSSEQWGKYCWFKYHDHLN